MDLAVLCAFSIAAPPHRMVYGDHFAPKMEPQIKWTSTRKTQPENWPLSTAGQPS